MRPLLLCRAGYDTSRCIPEPHEIALYRQRIQRAPLPALDSIRAEARARGASLGSAAEAERWLRDSMTGGVQRMLDMRLFADYNPAAGVQARSPRDLRAISARSPRDLGAISARSPRDLRAISARSPLRSGRDLRTPGDSENSGSMPIARYQRIIYMQWASSR